MNQPETSTAIVAVTIAILVILADIVVRMFLLPRRKEKLLQNLLDQLVESNAEEEESLSAGAKVVAPTDLSECLLRLFEKSGTSREILNTLASNKGLTHNELSVALNQRMAERSNSALPPSVAERVAVNLINAGLLTMEHGRLRSTEVGQRLNMPVQQRKGAALASAI
ncbi:MAG TPA: hypothetical protein VN673_04390 [Clostridia bacterium]|nr:hypothetical protein [Clostridia bacterium]